METNCKTLYDYGTMGIGILEKWDPVIVGVDIVVFNLFKYKLDKKKYLWSSKFVTKWL